jgi:hypothetical protein
MNYISSFKEKAGKVVANSHGLSSRLFRACRQVAVDIAVTLNHVDHFETLVRGKWPLSEFHCMKRPFAVSSTAISVAFLPLELLPIVNMLSKDVVGNFAI